MSNGTTPYRRRGAAPLTVEQLETGLRLLGRGDVDHVAFWDENVEAFKKTVLLAIRDTSDALLSPTIPLHWQAELETQLDALVQYLELANLYVARRNLSGERRGSGCPSSLARVH